MTEKNVDWDVKRQHKQNEYLLHINIITCFQSGFTAEDSSVNKLLELYNTFCQALDEGKEVCAIFVI